MSTFWNVSEMLLNQKAASAEVWTGRDLEHISILSEENQFILSN